MYQTRKVIKVIPALLVVCIFLCLTPVPAIAKDLLFPLKFYKSITSSFGEYRIGHPHAGLDFSTGLHNGRHVLAADSGDIIRVRVSYHGYGRALYQRTSDGRVLVYAHLDEFAPKIEKQVKQIQKQNGSYTFTRYFAPGIFPVKRGEVIGYSGDTGTDIPHLHFEVRNANNVTVNPLLNGLPIEDTIPPAIQKLHLEPRSFDAHTQGAWHEKVYSFREISEGNYTLDEPLKIGGKVGLSVQVTDYSNNSKRLLNPYRIEFQLNGKRIFLIRYDTFDYADGAISELDYNYRLKETKRGTFHRLYRYAKRIRFYPEDLTGDLSNLDPGQYLATIIASDANGNRSKANFTLYVNQPPRISTVDFLPKDDKLFIHVKAVDPDGQVTRVSVAKQEGKEWVEIPAPALGKGEYEAGMPLPAETTEFRILATDDLSEKSSSFYDSFSPGRSAEPIGEVDARHSFTMRGSTVSLLLLRSSGFSHTPSIRITLNPPLNTKNEPLDFIAYQEPTAIRINTQIPAKWPGGTINIDGVFKNANGVPYSGRWELPVNIVFSKGSIIRSADGVAQMVFPVDGVYSKVPCTVKRKQHPAPSWLEKITDVYSFSKKWEPMHKKARVSILIPEDTLKKHELGLYMYDRGVWWYMGNEKHGKNMVARVSHQGSFALMRDITAPHIGDISPEGVVDNLMPMIEVDVSDAGSGLYGGGIDFRLNGKKKIVQWHPIHGWIRFKPEKPLPVGTHKVVVTLLDRAGNKTTRSGTITISR